MRLNKYLAHAGVASRRKCDQFIEQGKVLINGRIMKDFSYSVDSADIVMCNGVMIDNMPKRKVFLVNKLKGYISTSLDPQKRKKVIDLINSNDRLFTVGRLDRDTTGAILVTNDGELANILMHPRNRIERIYFVLTKIDISRSKYNTLQKGIYLDDHAVAYGKIHRLGAENGFFHWKVILYEGKNHEVKRIFRALDSKVIHLHRYSFAGISIEHILPGKYRELKRNEIEGLLKLEQLSVKK